MLIVILRALSLAALLAAEPAALSRIVLESLALEGVRSERFTVAQARRLLGIASRYEMDGFLKAHGVMLPLTIEDIRHEVAAATAKMAK
jgi:hypothetical protein